MNQALVFYATALSGYSAKLRIVLENKGLAYEEREPPDGYRSQAYRRIVPMGTIPAIVIDNLVLSESEVIAEFLDESFPKPHMLPVDPQLRAQVRFLSRFHDLHLEPAVRKLFGQIDPKHRDPAFVEQQVAEITRLVSRLDGFVNPRPFALTSTLSLADCGYAVTLPLAKLMLQAIDRPLSLPPKIDAWAAELERHPAVVTALRNWLPATRNWIASKLAQADHGRNSETQTRRAVLFRPDWKFIEKNSIEQFEPSDWALLNQQRGVYLAEQQAAQVLRMLSGSKSDSSFGYRINNYQHCLQSATMAHRDGLDEEDVVVALLHDIGFITAPDAHGEFAAALLGPYISERNHWMLRHHAPFQNIHCPGLPGVQMNAREQWRGHPHFEWTARFVADYDQAAIDPDFENLPLEFFEPMVKRIFARPPVRRVHSTGTAS